MTALEAIDHASATMTTLAAHCREREKKHEAADDLTAAAISELQAKTFEACIDIIREAKTRITT